MQLNSILGAAYMTKSWSFRVLHLNAANIKIGCTKNICFDVRDGYTEEKGQGRQWRTTECSLDGVGVRGTSE